jgi:hypothetical protein
MIGKLKKMFLALLSPSSEARYVPSSRNKKLIRMKWHDGRILEFNTRREATEYFYLYGKVGTHVLREVDKTEYIRTYEQHRVK